MTGRVSVGSRVIVDTLLHSHARTRSARDLVGKPGTVDRLVPRGTSTYALVEMDESVRGFPGQTKWEVQLEDLYVITTPSTGQLEPEPADYTIGFEAYPVELRAIHGVRHAVPTSRAERPLTEAVCSLLVRPVHSPTWPIPFDPSSKVSCPGCVEGLELRHPIPKAAHRF
ncbi:hypothetical protein J2853_001491 [Streptosporangium lutulentum]|uniref:Uncharacterized protein n=1 Tax=Streptosporangium lutulentum TaxID=1461250 RepID=A0ABT9Q698_9ACTN|nr:hypothetical protein [Streptosporangium lutulentum]